MSFLPSLRSAHLAALALLLASCSGVDVVEPGELYLCTNLQHSVISRAIADHDLAAVLDLDGERPGDFDWKDARRVCSEQAVQYHTVDWSSGPPPSPDALLSLFAALDRSPRPILLVSAADSERLGLAAAFFLLEYRAADPDRAAREIRGSGLFGHWSRELLEHFDRSRRASGLPLRLWIDTEYRAWYLGRAAEAREERS